MSYIMLFDVGNTNIKIGLADAASVYSSYVLPTSHDHTADSLGLSLVQILKQAAVESAPAAIIVSSVVPRMDPLVRDACKRFLGIDIILVPTDKAIPLEVNYHNPSEIGADRLVGAYAARMLFPEPESIICVDYGTATTVDCVQGNTYLGGLICPGVFSSANALTERTAKLPGVSLEIESQTPMPVTSTAMCINHGFVFGFAAMTEGLCARIAKDLPGPVFVLATGGFAATIAKVTDCFNAVRSELLLEGLRLLYINE